jgi:hypothetical protein
MSPPTQFVPANPPEDFTTNTTIFPLSGQDSGKVVSTATSVTAPARTYNNAVQVELTRQGTATSGVDSMTIWIVPNVGIVRMELHYTTVGVITLVLTLYARHIGPARSPQRKRHCACNSREPAAVPCPKNRNNTR